MTVKELKSGCGSAVVELMYGEIRDLANLLYKEREQLHKQQEKGSSPLDKEVTTANDGFHLITIEPDGIIYVKGVYTLAPYYSPNGKLCHYVDGEIVEID